MSQPLSHDACYLRAIIDAMPVPVFVVDREIRIVDANPAGRGMFADGARADPAQGVRSGAAMRARWPARG